MHVKTPLGPMANRGHRKRAARTTTVAVLAPLLTFGCLRESVPQNTAAGTPASIVVPPADAGRGGGERRAEADGDGGVCPSSCAYLKSMLEELRGAPDGKPLAAVTERCPLRVANRRLRCVGRLQDEDEPEGAPLAGECDPDLDGVLGPVMCWLDPLVARTTPDIKREVQQIRSELHACLSGFEVKALPEDADWPMSNGKRTPPPILLSERSSARPGSDDPPIWRARVGVCPSRAVGESGQLESEWTLPLRFTWLNR
jgi:hypothetical protein